MNKQNDNSELIKVCNDCGREINTSSKFCPFCGAVFITPVEGTNEGENHGRKEEKVKQTSPWIMILVACILLFALISLVFFMPWRMPFSSFSNVK